MRARLIIGGLLAAWVAVASAAGLPPSVVAALKAANVPQSAIGIHVEEPGGETLLSFNADRPMNPASVMKLVTTYAALDMLGPAYVWRTEAYLNGTLQANGRLDGDLVLKGGADPRLTFENLWLLLRNLRSRGLTDINGDLVLDRNLFAVTDIDPSAFDGDGTRPYNQGPDALLLNFKSVRLTFIPDTDTRRVRILMEPPLPELRIVNEMTVVDGACTGWPEKPVVDMVSPTLVFRGAFPLACGEQTKHFSALPPLDYARALFDHLWRGLGGTWSGRVRLGIAPLGAAPFASFDSPTLIDAIRDINKFSNNVMARQLFLSLSLRIGGGATPEQSAAVVTEWFSRRNLPATGLVMENGSGLSRIERMSPLNLARMLSAAWDGPLGSEFAASLPIAGVDGTLKRRFVDSPVKGRAHLKTGFLDDVRAIAGYVHGANGRTMTVVVIINHANARAAAAVQEAAVEWALASADEVPCCKMTGRRRGKSRQP
ncbi:MAG: D-alanyl-D-alanine carboxypeptidase/D-alanyl-D-alanine-endopeptidase [Burkholderiales bacterium]|nr:D-alanyl-D-alanine carboxypeptidase/D-alanyl-D-alanine-endopeptidase [Burkholderiales bacterium]